jgi:hypothetical protein
VPVDACGGMSSRTEDGFGGDVESDVALVAAARSDAPAAMAFAIP